MSESEGEGSEVSELGTRAWGSSKKAFYSQQEVGVSSSDEADELEEREAIELQNRLAATLSEGDFLSVQALEDGGEVCVCLWVYSHIDQLSHRTGSCCKLISSARRGSTQCKWTMRYIQAIWRQVIDIMNKALHITLYWELGLELIL